MHHVLSATSVCNTRLQDLLVLTASADIQLHASELVGCDLRDPLNSCEILLFIPDFAAIKLLGCLLSWMIVFDHVNVAT